MRAHSVMIQSDDEYQLLSSLTKEKLQAFNEGNLMAAAKIDAALEIHEYCQKLIEYDKNHSRPLQHESSLNTINQFLKSVNKTDSGDELDDWELIKSEKETISYLDTLPIDVLMLIFSRLSMDPPCQGQ